MIWVCVHHSRWILRLLSLYYLILLCWREIDSNSLPEREFQGLKLLQVWDLSPIEGKQLFRLLYGLLRICSEDHKGLLTGFENVPVSVFSIVVII